MHRLFVLAALLFVLPAHAVTIDWVEVGDPGNACDYYSWACVGSVGYVYQISKYEVTNAQYAEFLNAVAASDPNALYGGGSMTRVGSSGSYTYSVIAGREDMPVTYVSFYDSLRFANWLHNGQPTGAQDSTTTEDGAYTMITESYPDGPFITRNAGATIFLTSEDEWYKAAYYDAVSTSYFDYPAGTDTPTVCAMPGATANTANCDYSAFDLTDVGSYTGSASPNGTFDQGGNAWEWNETIWESTRGLRGGSLDEDPPTLAAGLQIALPPTIEWEDVGFRVAMIPEPTTALLLACGLAGLAAAGRRRRS